MNRRAYRRIQNRLLLTGITGTPLCAGVLLLPWHFLDGAAGGVIFLAGFVTFLASGIAAFLVAHCHERRALYRALNAERTENERTLRARAHGDSVDDLKKDALRQGASLFGEGAALEVLRVSEISTALRRDLGAFTAEVIVRAHPDSIPAREVVTP